MTFFARSGIVLLLSCLSAGVAADDERPGDAAEEWPWDPKEVVVVPDELDGTPDLVVLVGHDMVYAPAAAGAPLLGSVELAITTRTLHLGYATLKSTMVGKGGSLLAKELGAGGDDDLTQACLACASFGFRVLRLQRGFVTAGLHYELRFIGDTAFREGTATGLGGELGYLRRQGRTFVHAVYSLQALTDHNSWLGQRQQLDVRAFWRGLGPFALYGHLGYAYASAGDRSFHGPIVQLGIAYVWQ